VAARHQDDVDELVGDADGPEGAERAERVVEYWAALGIDPVEVSLPRGGTGLTLREYRVAPADDVVDDEVVEDDDETAGAAEDETDESPEATDDVDDDIEEELDEDDAEDERPGKTRAGVAPGEEEAFFLATNGRLHLFKEPASLVAFVKSGAENDLKSSANWDELVASLTTDLLIPDDEDRYELDLVVDNLRGGHDVWERDLLVGAGEFARDLAYALDLNEVQAVLAAGSPLDDLDEAIRSKGFFARRKLKKVGSEQAALAWRSVIGRISSSVEWHD
jgi:hypothetical protein